MLRREQESEGEEHLKIQNRFQAKYLLQVVFRAMIGIGLHLHLVCSFFMSTENTLQYWILHFLRMLFCH